MPNVPSGLIPALYRLYSKPIQLVELYLESPYTNPSHFYCGNNEDITFNSQVYTAIAAKRSSIRSEEGTILQELNIQLDNIDLEFRTLIASGMLDRKKCVIKLVFYDFLSDPANYVTLYSGYLDAPSGDNRWCTLLLKPFSIFEREFPRRIYQTGCNWTFGDAQCGITLSDYQLTTYIGASGSGTPVTSTFLPYVGSGWIPDYFVPGYVLMTSGSCDGQVRPILYHSDISITLRVALDGVPAYDDTLLVQKLCAKTPAFCQAYSNYLNYGGFPQTPLKPTL